MPPGGSRSLPPLVQPVRHPELTVTDEYDAESGVYRLHVSQHTPPTQDQPQKLPLHIPSTSRLYDAQGAVIPLQYQGKAIGNVLDVLEAQQTFEFDRVPVRPIPSLLRDFSAPVKLHYDYSDEALAFLMRHARNEFARWDAAQMLINKAVIDGVAGSSTGRGLNSPTPCWRPLSPFWTRLHWIPPSRQRSWPCRGGDPGRAVRGGRHRRHPPGAQRGSRPHWPTPSATACWRATRACVCRLIRWSMPTWPSGPSRVVLGYLAALDAAKADTLVREQYEAADNMTDTWRRSRWPTAICCRAAPRSWPTSKANGPMMAWYWTTGCGWWGPSRPSDVLHDVKQAMAHPTFSIRNPNRLRALIGSFAMNNQVQFHAADGSGYRFLTDLLIELQRGQSPGGVPPHHPAYPVQAAR